MKRICLLAILVLITFCDCTFGQFLITGKVMNSEENGIPGATVTCCLIWPFVTIRLQQTWS